MQVNWSLILNILLLVGVVIAISRLIKARKQSLDNARCEPIIGAVRSPYDDAEKFTDDIIAVRKITTETPLEDENSLDESEEHKPCLMSDDEESLVLKKESKLTPKIELDCVQETPRKVAGGHTLMMFLLAKENRQFAGYELLQTVLAAGLRFGDGGLFHRHRFNNGQGAVLCSLAAATEAGTFDLPNMGAFSVRGLCLYMRSTNNSDLDSERFSVMLDIAKQLRDGLDAYLLDDKRTPFNEESLERYQKLVHINCSHLESFA